MKKIIHFFIFAIICFVFLEQATRFYLFGFDSFNYFKMNSIHDIGVSGLIKPPSNLEIIYELRPNLNTYFKMSRFKTNSQGLRDQEYTTKKGKGVFRVVVLGDSFTMPSGVNIEDAFHSILENRFNAESGNVLYEFINFGVGGYDPAQCLATLKYRALGYEPDLVLFCLSGPIREFYDERYKRQIYKIKSEKHPFFSSFLVELIKRNIIVNYFTRNFSEADKNKKAKVHGGTRLEKIKNLFLELEKIRKTQNIPIRVVILQHYYGNQEEISEVEGSALKHGLYVIDTSAPFKNTKLAEYTISLIDQHPNAKANRIFANVIYEYFKKEDLLKMH